MGYKNSIIITIYTAIYLHNHTLRDIVVNVLICIVFVTIAIALQDEVLCIILTNQIR